MLSFSLIDALCVVINLFVLFLVLRKVLFAPVTKMIETRQQEIDDNLSHAAQAEAEAQEALTQYNEQLLSANTEARAIVDAAKARGETEYQAALQAAEETRQSLLKNAEVQIEAERTQMLDGVRNEVASLALLAAARVSACKLDEESDALLVESFLQEVGASHE